jgi:hypothetical protein
VLTAAADRKSIYTGVNQYVRIRMQLGINIIFLDSLLSMLLTSMMQTIDSSTFCPLPFLPSLHS